MLQKLDRTRISRAWQIRRCLARGFARWSCCAWAAVQTLRRVLAPPRVPPPGAQALTRGCQEKTQALARQRGPLRQVGWGAAPTPEARPPRAAAPLLRAPEAVAPRPPRSTVAPSMRSNATVTPRTAIWPASRASVSVVRRRTSLPAGRVPIAARATLIARAPRPALKRRLAVSRSPPRAIACWCVRTKTNPSGAPPAWPATCRQSHRSAIAFGNERLTAVVIAPRASRDFGDRFFASQPAACNVLTPWRLRATTVSFPAAAAGHRPACPRSWSAALGLGAAKIQASLARRS